MAAELFVDTSAWFALASVAGRDSARVQGTLRERLRAGMRLVTTNLILAETHALLLRRADRLVALTFLREISQPPNVIVSSTPEIEERAIAEWLERYEDQPFSLTDAVSFTIMVDRDIREALALDHHFAIAGFIMLPAQA